MSNKPTGGPAFPRPMSVSHGGYHEHQHVEPPQDGITLRQYAAIKLRVPDSGTDWLDEMILTSQRNELAAKALNAALMTCETASLVETINLAAKTSYQVADAMLEARRS